MADALGQIRKCLRILNNDMKRLEKIDRYSRGDHDDPYIPDLADAEYKLLAKRCVTNVTGFVVGTVGQALYVDGFRRSDSLKRGREVEPEWEHWQNSRLDARQNAVYRGALTFGHAFVVTERVGDRVLSRGLSPLRTAAIYADPSVDEDALMVVHVKEHPVAVDGKNVPGEAVAWDDTFVYEVAFDSWSDLSKVRIRESVRHGLSQNPVTRFAASVDLEGRTVGVIEPLIPLQDRLNQTVFDCLVVQSGSSFKVRTISGMAPPMKTEPVYERPNGTPADPNDRGEVIGAKAVIDPSTGRPIPASVNINARRVMFAEDPEVRFGTLDETPLDGFIASIEMSFKHISALSQTPPHHLLGQIANLSAEALQAAETSLQRKVAEFQSMFGESWERVFRIAAALAGDDSLVDDVSGEVIWRDMEQRSLAQAGDALGKLTEQLKIPPRGLWTRVPGVTRSEILQWERLADEEDSAGQLAAAINRASSSGAPSFRSPVLDTGPADAPVA